MYSKLKLALRNNQLGTRCKSLRHQERISLLDRQLGTLMLLGICNLEDMSCKPYLRQKNICQLHKHVFDHHSIHSHQDKVYSHQLWMHQHNAI